MFWTAKVGIFSDTAKKNRKKNRSFEKIVVILQSEIKW